MENTPIDVLTLSTGEIQTFVGITPREAVIAAHAQANGDFNTWDYAKYEESVLESSLCVTVGNHSAFKDARRLL